MAQNRLLQLLARNAKKGEFRAEGNTIYVYDMIVSSDADAEWLGGVSAETFVKTLRGMTGDVQLRINSPGGDVFGAVAMVQAIREYAGKVTAMVDGYAASAASFLTSAADETVMAAGSMIMIHKAWTIELGNSDDLAATAALLAKIDGNIVDAYVAGATRRGVEPVDFEVLMKAETWLNGDEAVAIGMADSVATPAEKDLSAKAQARWDMSAYDHAPAAPVAAIPPALAEVTGDMLARQQQLYDAVEGIAEELGQFDQTSGGNGAHYMADNPFAAQGIKCANCAFFDGARACEAVAGDIDPEAVCKLWIIPEALISETSGNTAAAQAQIEQPARPNHSAAMLLRPAA